MSEPEINVLLDPDSFHALENLEEAVGVVQNSTSADIAEARRSFVLQQFSNGFRTDDAREFMAVLEATEEWLKTGNLSSIHKPSTQPIP